MEVKDILPHLEAIARSALASLGCDETPPLAPPPRASMGDFGFASFAFAKKVGERNPKAFADKLVVALEGLCAADPLIAGVSATGPYVNFQLSVGGILAVVVGELAGTKAATFGGAPVDPDAPPVLIEYSSPNTNKPQHLGHVRNNLLGEVTANILSHRGHRVIRANLINDRGIHICKSMLAYERYGNGETPESAGIKGDLLVGNYYIEFDRRFREEYAEWLETDAAQETFAKWKESSSGKRAVTSWVKKAKKKNKTASAEDLAPSAEELFGLFAKSYRDPYFNRESVLGAETSDMLRRWEAGDSEVRALWATMNSWVEAGFAQTYERLGIHFDHYDHESETYLLGKDVIEDALERGLLTRADNGAVVFDLEKIGLSGQKALLRADGTSLYTTQDLGTALTRFEQHGLGKMIYVVGDEQNHHFRTLFGILGELRPELAGRFHHLTYGMVNLPHGRMKSREGTVVDADDLMDEMDRLGIAEVKTRDTDSALPDEVVQQRGRAVGMAALKYYLLNFAPVTSFTFDPEKSVDFLGQTGPYCMYAFARTSSILRKAEYVAPTGAFDPARTAALGSDLERQVVMQVLEFPQMLEWAANQYDPSKMTEYAFRLAKSLASFFSDADHHVLDAATPELREARLHLIYAVNSVMGIALRLLGIDTLDKM